ncbi:hypothetical protein ACI3PL_30440, partial [Lacticaseibacillus paracasei]
SDGQNEFLIPVEWQQNGEAGTRGIITSALKLLGISVVKKTAGKPIAKAIAEHIDKNNDNKIYWCDSSFNLIKTIDVKPI